MLTWLSNNIATIVICVLLCAAVVGVIVHMIRNKKKGRSACGCGCSSCPMEGKCHKD